MTDHYQITVKYRGKYRKQLKFSMEFLLRKKLGFYNSRRTLGYHTLLLPFVLQLVTLDVQQSFGTKSFSGQAADLNQSV